MSSSTIAPSSINTHPAWCSPGHCSTVTDLGVLCYEPFVHQSDTRWIPVPGFATRAEVVLEALPHDGGTGLTIMVVHLCLSASDMAITEIEPADLDYKTLWLEWAFLGVEPAVAWTWPDSLIADAIQRHLKEQAN